MTLSSYPAEINTIIGQDIEISVIMVAPPWSSIYDNVGKVRAVLNGIEVGNSGQRFLPGGGVPLNIIFNIPGNAIPIGTHNLVLVTELRYEYQWLNAGNYNVTVISVEACTPNWQTGEWEDCQPDNTQTRIVTDLNNCNDTTGKPTTIQSCIYIPCNLSVCDFIITQ